MTPGIYNLTSDEYHADPAPVPSLSSSIASILLNQSPQHAYLAHPRLNPFFERSSTSRFDLGSAAHMMLLERSNSKIVIVQADDWRTKAAKEARDAAQAQGNYAVLERQYNDIVEMVASARGYIGTTELSAILRHGIPEQSVFWQEGEIWCRARPDMLSADQAVILDYKTSDSAAPEHFAKQIGRMNYDLQAEFYLRGVPNATFVFLVQEITPPYACSLISLSNAYREVGQLKVKRAIKIWSECMESQRWPGYTSKILYAEPKAWDLMQAEELNSEAEGE